MDVLTTSMAEQPFGYDPETTSFVAFGNTTANRKLLVGYGFVGRDMVIGEEGRASWEAAGGASPSPVARTVPMPSSRRPARRS